jgi:iron complex outermembrane receptor protein
MPHAFRPLPRGARRLALMAGAAVGLPTMAHPVVAPVRAQEPSPASQAARQAGRIVGTVTDENRQAVPGAQVNLVGTRLGALTGPDGRFRITGVPAGTYDVRVQRIGQRIRTVPGIAVRGGEDVTVDVALEGAPATLGGVVVSASRRVGKDHRRARDGHQHRYRRPWTTRSATPTRWR